MGAFAAGLLAELVLDEVALGINVPIMTIAVLAIVTWSSQARRPADPVDWWLAGIAMAASIGPALRTDTTTVALDLALVFGGVAGWSLAVGGIPFTRRATAAVAGLALETIGAAAIGVTLLVRRAGADGALARGGVALGRLAPFVRGLVIALPVVVVFTFLFASADAVFGRGLDEVFRDPIDLDEAIRRAVFVGITVWLVGGMVAIAGGAYRPMLGVAGDGGEPSAAAESGGQPGSARSGATESLIVLAAVDVLFAVFAAVQVVYLFGGRDTLAEIGMTYSDYARQGYFQLVAAVGLAGLLLIGVHVIVGRTRGFVIGAFVLLGLIGLILASAGFRLRLYQEAYGWTELRFYVATSILWLAACASIAAALLWRDQMRWLAHGLAMSAVAITLAISALGPRSFVAEQNLARLIDPALVAPGGRTGFDASYAVTLGDDAIPALVSALEHLDPYARGIVLHDLWRRRGELATDTTTASWPSWNLSRERAKAALARIAER